MMGFDSPQERWVGLSANPWPTSQSSSCSPETTNVIVGYSLIGWLELSTKDLVKSRDDHAQLKPIGWSVTL